MAKFSKKHYEEIARVLQKRYYAELGSMEASTMIMKIREDFIVMLKEDNDRFDIDKFRIACVKPN